MGHYCRICGRARANEKFSGKGHRVHVCKDCARLPKEHREAVEQEQEVFGYLKQSHISDKNLRRLRTLASSDQPRIAELAAIAIEVAEVKPYKKRRLKVLGRERPDLLKALNRTGLIFAHHDL
jgi:ribosome-binding protein aMBF1 (putative translation factor)